MNSICKLVAVEKPCCGVARMKGRVEKAEAKDRVAKTTSAYRDTIVNFYFVGSSRLFLILKLFCPFLGAYAYLCLDKDEV
jgi:hypothetical protein